MEQEYATSTWYKIFYGLGAIAFAGFTIFISTSAGGRGNHQSTGLILFPVIGIIGGIMIFINLYKRKVVLSDDQISYTNIWGSKEIPVKEVKGYRVSDKAIYIEPVDAGYSKLSIKDYASINNQAQLIEWLRGKFTDLNKADYEASKQQILKDTSLGYTQEAREQKLKSAKTIAKTYIIISVATFFIPIFIHTFNNYFALVMLAYPLIGIVIIVYGKGLIRLFAPKNSAYASITIGLFFPAFALVIRSFNNDEILNYDKLYLPVALVGLVMLVLLYIFAIKNITDKVAGQWVSAVLIAAAYGLGSILQVNSGFDKSIAQVYPVTVIDHYVTHGKSTSYNITIDEWRPNHSSENIAVSESFYNNAPVGSKVNVNLKHGALDIPWYYVSQ